MLPRQPGQRFRTSPTLQKRRSRLCVVTYACGNPKGPSGRVLVTGPLWELESGMCGKEKGEEYPSHSGFPRVLSPGIIVPPPLDSTDSPMSQACFLEVSGEKARVPALCWPLCWRGFFQQRIMPTRGGTSVGTTLGRAFWSLLLHACPPSPSLHSRRR